MAVAAYQQLADAIDLPLHIGITEAGGLRSGTIKSAIALVIQGQASVIRSACRCLLTVEEVKAGYEMLKLWFATPRVTVISCPSCARQQFDVIKTVQIMKTVSNILTYPLPCRLLAVW